MIRKTLFAATVVAASFGAHASIAYDDNVTPGVIMGSGVTNGSFTTDTANGLELGLRGKLRHNAAGQAENIFNSNSDGTYTFATGVAPTQPSPTAVWSFEWAINTDVTGLTGSSLAGYTYMLGLDTDASQGLNWTTFDLIKGANPASGVVCWEHSTGTNTTTAANDQIANCGAATAAADMQPC